jgi:hypothetical protein
MVSIKPFANRINGMRYNARQTPEYPDCSKKIVTKTGACSVPVKHDAPGNKIPIPHSLEHPAGVAHPPARSICSHQRGPDEPIILDPNPYSEAMRAPNRFGAARSGDGAEQRRERAASRRGQASAAEADAGGEREDWSGESGAQNGEVGTVGFGAVLGRDGVAAAEKVGMELLMVAGDALEGRRSRLH